MTRWILTTAFVATVLGLPLAACSDARTTAPPTQPRQLFMSPTGIDSAPCTRSAPCATLGRAYRMARAGDVVELAAGTYDAAVQEIHADPSKRRGDPVIFRPAVGAGVTIKAQVKIAAARVFLRNMRFAGGWFVTGDRITFKNINTTGLVILSATNIKVLGGQVYPGPVFQGEQDGDPLLGSATGGKPPTNIVFDGVWFHGWLRPPGTDYHTECLQAGSGINVVIRRSRFSDCATHDVLIQSWGGLNGADNSIDNWVLENNFFGATHDGYYTVQLLDRDDVSGRTARFRFRNNSWAQAVHLDVRPTTAVDLTGNLGAQSQWECGFSKGKITWSYNVFTAARCSKTDRRAAVRFLDANTLDLRVPAGAAAIDRGDPRSFPSIDIFGNARPRGGRPDAGAVEIR